MFLSEDDEEVYALDLNRLDPAFNEGILVGSLWGRELNATAVVQKDLVEFSDIPCGAPDFESDGPFS